LSADHADGPAVVGWQGRLWTSVYVVRSLVILGCALACWYVTDEWWLTMYALSIALPYNVLIGVFHRHRRRPSVLIVADQVLAAGALLIDGAALPGVIIVVLQSGVVGTLALGVKPVRVALASSTALMLVGGVVQDDPAPVAFAVVATASAFALSNLIVYLGERQRSVELRVSGVLDGIDAMVYEADARSGELLYVNRGLADVFPDGPPATTSELSAVVHPDDLGPAQAALEAAAQRRDTVTVTMRVNTAEGERIVEQRTSYVQGRSGRVRSRNVMIDVTEHHLLRNRLQTMALTDGLTGLANRAMLLQRLEDALCGAQTVTLMILDLDRFKAVNDNHGHSAGDRLLQAVAERLVRQTRASDTVARLGGDEFAIVLVDASDRSAADVAERICVSVAEVSDATEPKVSVSISVGYATAPLDGRDVSTLMQAADRAMYRAKRSGGSWCAYQSFVDQH
jgi:diguanylate cyclase (GGDEF)-like protein